MESPRFGSCIEETLPREELTRTPGENAFTTGSSPQEVPVPSAGKNLRLMRSKPE